ncbi:ABC transporter substrate-binding protein [Frigidibacter albus]|uniref:ABC transporter substrate-binding protein n=1 Tax=Frigidibacter albus TaxID=1465486 RepID=A0A6L8VDF0_9RHOB|nr:siderophore ABC transporter substrate-binding protein [Frigidibacter albus]MZQ87706.1 ABC transporter substrate-binding protein [Frigidibacter albus]NBE29612.1 ABC transporter substrate-binding protein [Frigidibacter albus]GGH43811.1 iron ABC transporter substrate-binding protein [Frigidibacter albus]
MNRFSLAGLVAAALLSCLPASAQTVNVDTARGAVDVAAQPDTVAVFDIAALDTIHALGITPAGVPDKLYVPYLSDLAGAAAAAGTLFEPDLEALAALGPELIILGGRSSTQVESVSGLAPTIDMTIGMDLVADARARIGAYGAIFGAEDKAGELLATLDAKLAETAEAAAGKGTALIVMANGPKVSAYGEGSRFGWIHSALDLPEAHENLDPETHGDAISFEFIAEVNPDWLIVIDRGAAIGEAGGASATLDNALVQGTTAAQKGQIVYLDPAPIYIAGGGYTSMMQTLDELLAAFAG